MSKLALGVCTHLGWATVSAVLLQRVPVAVRTFRLETGDPADRRSLEPYHVAGGFDGLSRVPPPEDPARVVRDGTRRQRQHTRRKLDHLLLDLNDWPPPATGALFVGRGRQAATLDRVLASHAQIHVAEGNAVRDAVRHAFAASNIPLLGVDRRTLLEQVAARLDLDEAAVGRLLAALAPDNAGAWRKEERHCALAAWLSTTD